MPLNHSSPAEDRLLTSAELEHMLGVSRGWAAKDRCGEARIPHVAIGRSRRYRLADIQRFIETSIRKSTSDPGPQNAAA